MNHRSVLNGTPLDARHDNVALVARRLGYEPALFGYTDTSIDPRTVAPDDPRLRTLRGRAPRLRSGVPPPRGQPGGVARLDARRRASTCPTTGGTFVDQPAAGTQWRTQYDAKHSADRVPHRPAARLRRRPVARPGRRGSRTSRSCGRTRRSSRPRRTTRCSTPRRFPRRCAPRRRAEEGAQHPLLGVMIDHPFLAVARRPAGTARAAGDLLRDDRRGRRPARPHLRRGSTRRARPTTRSWCFTSRSRRDARRPLDAAQARLVRPDVPRAADRARPARVRRDARPRRRRVHRARRRAADDLRAARRRGAVAVRRPAAHAVAATARRPTTGAPRCTPSSTSAIPTARCSKTRSASRSRSARSRCCATTTGSTCSSPATRRCRRSSSTSTSIPTQIVNRAADPAYAAKVLDYAQRMLAWRMRHTERTLTGMKLTGHAGLVERNAPASLTPGSPRIRISRSFHLQRSRSS